MHTDTVDRTASHASRWMLSVHPIGQGLAVASSSGGVHVVVLVAEGEFDRAGLELDVERRVSESVERSARDCGPRRLPGPLHHAAQAFGAWMAEAGPDHGARFVLLLQETDGVVGIVHLGGEPPQVRAAGTGPVAPWVTVFARGGVEARAKSFYAGRLSGLALSWNAGSTVSHGGHVEARLENGMSAPADAPGGAGAPSGIATAEIDGVVAAPSRTDALSTDAPATAAAADAVQESSIATETERPAEEDDTPDAAADPGTIEPAREDAPDVAAPSPARRDEEPTAMAPAEPRIEDAPPRASAAGSAPSGGPLADPALAGRPSIVLPDEPGDAWPEPADATPVPEEPLEVPVAAPVERAAPPPLRPELPETVRPVSEPRLRRWWPWAAGMAVLFAGGWLLGQPGVGAKGESGEPSRVTRALRAVGLGGAWADLEVTSEPAGAWVAVDGKDRAVRTPATIEVEPGDRVVTFSLDGLGETQVPVRVSNHERRPLGADLRGTLRIGSADPDVPVEVEVDGEAVGYAPVTVDALDPGPHLVQFTAPGMPPWTQTVEVRVRGEAEVIARPFHAPETGMIEIRATRPGVAGPEALRGASVWVDGEARGQTPLVLELPRGPHSIRLHYDDESPPVQIIDLPGGNQRFATFRFGTGDEAPTLTFVTTPKVIPSESPLPFSVAIEGVPIRDLRRMWLHVRSPEGTWHRYPMTLLPSAGGAVGTVVFPAAMADARGLACYYASATTASGDEYFTELRDMTK